MKNNPKHLSLLGMVNFYRTLLKQGIIAEGSQGFNRMMQLEDKLRMKRHGVRGKRVPV